MRLEPLSEGAVGHIAYNLRQTDRDELGAMMSRFDSAVIARAAVKAPYGFVACADDGVPVACVGAAPWWPGVYQVGMFATAAWPSVALAVTRHVKREWIPGIRKAGVRRAHAFSLASHREGQRWIELLGGVLEGRLARFGVNGEDFMLYRWE